MRAIKVTVRSKVNPAVEIRGTYEGAEYDHRSIADPNNGVLRVDDPELHILYELSRAHWEIVKTMEGNESD